MNTEMLLAPSPALFISVEKACASLAHAFTVLEAKRVKDVAEAMRVWARAQKDGGEAQRQAAEIVLRAERRMGQLLADAKKNGERANNGDRGRGRQTSHAVTSVPTLAELGIDNREQASRYQKIASLPDDQFEAFVEQAKEEAKELTTAAALRLANGGVLAAFSSESVEWYTPPKYIEAARLALGGAIDLDPASSAKANETVRASTFFTEQDDGLKRPWGGRVWLNPPYAKDVTTEWVEYLAEECDSGRVVAAVLLVNAVPDRSWFAHVWRARLLCFTDHRIEFYTPSGQPRSPVCSNVFAYWGKDDAAFIDAFTPFGTVVRKA